MKSTKQVRIQLGKQWQNSQHRSKRLLGDGFPVVINIGKPSSKAVYEQTQAVRTHLQDWQQFSQLGIGHITWQHHYYQATQSEICYPASFTLHSLQDWQAAVEDNAIQQEMTKVMALLAHPFVHFLRHHYPVLSNQQLGLLLNHLKKVADEAVDTLIQLLVLANLLTPNCAAGLPLRALSLTIILARATGNDIAQQIRVWLQYHPMDVNLNPDSKFFQSHQKLLVLLLNTRFDNLCVENQANEERLVCFLGAERTHAHWLLLVDMGNVAGTEIKSGWLPFAQVRVRDIDLQSDVLYQFPYHQVLIVENEQCLHQLLPLAQLLSQTMVILGAGQNLSWLAHHGWQQKRLAYWGDIDSWGLAMLSQARGYQPSIQPLMMDMATLRAHQHAIVYEPTCYPSLPANLTQNEQTLFLHLLHTDPQGKHWRLEQEFILPDWAEDSLYRFVHALSVSS